MPKTPTLFENSGHPLYGKTFEECCAAFSDPKAHQYTAQQLFGLEAGFSAAQVKSAYKKLSLYFHPDKSPGVECAEAGFRGLARANDCLAYQFLTENEKRDALADYNGNPFNKISSTPPPPRPSGFGFGFGFGFAGSGSNPHSHSYGSSPPPPPAEPQITRLSDLINALKKTLTEDAQLALLKKHTALFNTGSGLSLSGGRYIKHINGSELESLLSALKNDRTKGFVIQTLILQVSQIIRTEKELTSVLNLLNKEDGVLVIKQFSSTQLCTIVDGLDKYTYHYSGQLPQTLRRLSSTHHLSLINALGHDLTFLIADKWQLECVIKATSDNDTKTAIFKKLNSRLRQIIKSPNDLNSFIKLLDSNTRTSLLENLESLDRVIFLPAHLLTLRPYLTPKQTLYVFEKLGDELGRVLSINSCQALQRHLTTDGNVNALIIKAVKHKLKDIILGPVDLYSVLYKLNPPEITLFIQQIDIKKILQHSHSTTFITSNLNPRQKVALNNAIKAFIKTSDDVFSSKESLYGNGPWIKLTLDLIKESPTDVFDSAKRFGKALSFLTEAELHLIIPKLITLVTDEAYVLDLLQPLERQQSKTLLSLLKIHAPHVINDKTLMQAALKSKDNSSIERIISALDEDIKTHIPSGVELGLLIQQTNTEQTDRLLKALSANLNIIVHNAFSLGDVLGTLEEQKQNQVLNFFHSRLKDLVLDISDFTHLVKTLTPVQTKGVFEAAEVNLTRAIHSKETLEQLISPLTESQKEALFSSNNFMQHAMTFDRSYFQHASEDMKNSWSMQAASYVPFLALAMQNPEICQSILLGLIVGVLVAVSLVTTNLTIAPIIAGGALAATLSGVGFFALTKKSPPKDDDYEPMPSPAAAA